MKNILLTIITLLVGISVFAQQPENALAMIKYRFIHIRDTTDRKNPYTEDMVMFLAKNLSSYNSIDAQTQQQQITKSIQQQIKNSKDPNQYNLEISGGRPVSEGFYQAYSDRKLFSEQKMINLYLVEVPLPSLSWKINKDTLTISGLHCQKASTHFKGRDYEAWFCPSLPFHNGPWKLSGLPGLIIEVQDIKKEVIFQFAGFEDVRSKNITVELPEAAIPTTLKEFERLKEVAKTNPGAIAKIKSNIDILDGVDPNKIKSLNVKPTQLPFGTVVNNPIELSGKE